MPRFKMAADQVHFSGGQAHRFMGRRSGRGRKSGRGRRSGLARRRLLCVKESGDLLP